MFHGFFRTLVKITVASLVVGTLMNHFGVTTEHLLQQVGLTPERAVELDAAGHELGTAKSDAGRTGDRASVVRDLSVPAAAPARPVELDLRADRRRALARARQLGQ